MGNIKNIIGNMTLSEKASMCSGQNFWNLKGIERLGIPSIMVTDGPHGLRKNTGEPGNNILSDNVPATCFPTASALAATWNRDLIYQVGEALAEECLEEKVGVILGPGANIKRSPLCGRNFEYFSEDPYLSGEIAKSHINGVQSKGIGTSLKHYAVNNQEYRRMVINAIVDERALREIYLAGFEIAVKDSQPWTVMCAYNRLNGTYCCEHETLLKEILKDEWGHEGIVITDWGAMNDRVAALIAGTELEMPGTGNGNDGLIEKAVREGILDESILDSALERILGMVFRADKNLAGEYTYDRQAHHAFARKVAGEGAVLLKNAEDLLPLTENTKVALLGRFAKHPRYQGAGSSSMNPTRLDNLHDEIISLIGEGSIVYAPGYSAVGGEIDIDMIREAVDIVGQADVAVICAGLTDNFEVEGIDRKHMRLPAAHDALIEAVAEVHSNVVVVLSNGSPVEMPWIDRVKVVLEGYLGGQAGAGAIRDILYGFVNPSGKLAESFPFKLEDNPSHLYFPGGPDTVEYRESIYVGYRYYDTANKDVLFPFGHGLSYTSFEYSRLGLNEANISIDDNLIVTFMVKNTGLVAGKEVVQLYVRDIESTIFRPDKELKGFEKVALEPGEEVQVAIDLDFRSFAFFDTGLKDWCVETGEFEILVGASSRDIRLSTSVSVESNQLPSQPMEHVKLTTYFELNEDSAFRKEGFESLYGKKIPSGPTIPIRPYTANTPMGDMVDSFTGRLFGRIVRKQIQKMIADDPDNPNSLMIQTTAQEAPLRLMFMFGEGVTREMVDALLLMINGKVIRGLVLLVKSIRSKKRINNI